MTKACTTHHHACDCREAEWAQKMAAQQLRIEGLERLLADRWENLNCLDNEIDMKNARIEELEHYNVGLATESVAQQARIAELEEGIRTHHTEIRKTRSDGGPDQRLWALLPGGDQGVVERLG